MFWLLFVLSFLCNGRPTAGWTPQADPDQYVVPADPEWFVVDNDTNKWWKHPRK